MTPSAEDVREAAEQTERAQLIATMCKVLFAGEPSTVAGAALAELMSIFLYGHQIPDDPSATQRMRKAMLEQWCQTVRDLVDAYEADGMRKH